MSPDRASEAFTEGPEPELNKVLPLDNAISQLADFFGVTEDNITEILKPQKTRPGTEGTTTQLILSGLRKTPTGLSLRVEACNADAIVLGTGTMAYLYDEGELMAAPIGVRM